MRSAPIWLLILVAGAAAWLLFTGGGSSDAPTTLPGTDAPLPVDGPKEGPKLLGSGTDRPHVPMAIRGRGVLQGMTRQGGVGVPAQVELRHVFEIDPQDPVRGGVASMMIERMLDSGISGKPVIARMPSGEDGRFHFKGLAPGLYEVRAVAASGAIGLVSATLPAAGARVEVNVDLPDGDQTLKGRVVHADGTPYRGLVVLTAGMEAMSAMMGRGAAHVRPAQTDEQGRFEIPALSPGRYQLSAIVPGRMRAMAAPFAVPYAGEYLLTIHAAGVQIKGRVIAAKTEQPIAGALVLGGGGDPSSSFMLASTTSAADGTFTLTVPVGGGAGMFVRAEGYAPQMVQLHKGHDEEVVVSMLELGRLSGRVTAKEGGTPVAGVSVFAANEGRSLGFGGNVQVAVTDTDGRYAYPGLPPGAVKLHALGKGWASLGLTGIGPGSTNTPYVAEIEPGGAAELDLEVGPGAGVRGHVVDAGGQPVAGAVIQAGGPENLGQAFAAMMGLGMTLGSAVSDGDGAFSIDVLVPETDYRLVAKAPEHPDATSATFQVAAGDQATIDLTFPAARWFDVRVTVGSGGQPLSGATVVAQPKDRSKGRLRLGALFGVGTTWTTDGDGRAHVGPLAAGELRIRAVAPGYVEDGVDVTADQDGPLTIALQKGLVIAGTIRIPEGVPPQSIRVTVERDPTFDGAWFHRRAVVQADGTWRVEGIKDAGQYTVTAAGNWQSRRFVGAVSVEAGHEDVVLELHGKEGAPASEIEVLVTDAEGKTVPSGRVALTRFHEGGSGASTTNLSNGEASFSGMGGEGELWVEVFDLVGEGRGATIQGPVTPEDGKVEVRLPRPLTIQGTVRDEDGRGVAGVRLRAKPHHPHGTDQWGQTHATAVSDGDGHFRLRRLGPHSYRLTAEGSRDMVPIAPIDVRAGDKDVVILTRRGLRAVLTLLDHAGKPVVGARAQVNRAHNEQPGNPPSLVPSMGMSEPSSSDTSGVITLRGLAPDQVFGLRISPPRERDDLKSISVEGWHPADGTLRFQRGYVIMGSVLTNEGKPVQRVRLQYRKQGGASWSSTWVGSGGVFRIAELDAGNYELLARPSEARWTVPDDAEPTIVRAGARKVRLVLDLGPSLTVHVSGLLTPGRRSQQRGTALLFEEGEGTARLQGNWIRQDRVQFRGLDAGKHYRLLLSGLPGGKFVLREGVGPQSQPLTVQARSGGTITGRIKAPAGDHGLHVSVSAFAQGGTLGGATIQGTVDAKTLTFRIEGLPEGTTWRVAAFGWGEGRTSLNGRAEKVALGADIEIELKAR